MPWTEGRRAFLDNAERIDDQMATAKSGSNLHTSLGLSTLFNFYKRNEVPLGELAKLEGQFEQSGTHNGTPLWTPKIGKSEDEIRYFNQSIMEWVWNFRDFFWIYAVKHLGMTLDQAQAMTRATVAGSDALQLCGYFRNLESHVELTNFKEYAAFELNPPRLGEVWIHFLMDNGDTTYRTDLAGAEYHQSSTKFPFIQTVHIERFPGERDTRRVAEDACWEWIDLLKANGVDLGVVKPQWFECKPVIKYLGMGTSPKAIAAGYIRYPTGMVGPSIDWDEVEQCVIRLDGPLEPPTTSPR